jgi:hypothetical protein
MVGTNNNKKSFFSYTLNKVISCILWHAGKESTASQYVYTLDNNVDTLKGIVSRDWAGLQMGSLDRS